MGSLRSVVVVASFALLSGCQTTPSSAEISPQPEASGKVAESPVAPKGAGDTKNEPKPGHTRHGDALTPGAKAVALTSVLASPEEYAGKTVTVKGEVRQACTRKGCWMELAEGQDKKSQGCRVTFKDYGFFVPTNSAGSSATAQGQVVLKRLSAEQVAHYESEGATFSHKNPDGSANEVRLVATGVELAVPGS